MVRNGIDNLRGFEGLFRGRRLGLITSVSGVNSRLRSTVDILHERFGLAALFSPEHGVRGDREAGATVDSYTDVATGLPVHSLYRADGKRLTAEMLDGVDALVYDIQDVGARFYTYLSTLLYAIEDCAAAGKPLIVVDRVNPLGGAVVEGNLPDVAYTSFVGAWPMPIRYGLTAGEYARMVNAEGGFGCELHVLPVTGWRREMLYPDTGLLWMMPSLGLPRFETALLYPGHCLIEGTNLSEGRGTSCPFEIIGAPWVEGPALAAAMNRKGLPGVLYTSAHFTPTASKHAGVACGGIHAHVTDPRALQPVALGAELLFTLREMYPAHFAFLPPLRAGGRSFIELLGGGPLFRDGQSAGAVLAQCAADSAAFAARKTQYHLYD